jgi:hypothetical protein
MLTLATDRVHEHDQSRQTTYPPQENSPSSPSTRSPGPTALVVDRGYIATAVGGGDRAVPSQMTFRGEDFAAMKPGTGYTNDTDPDARELVGRSAEDFTADVGSRD